MVRKRTALLSIMFLLLISACGINAQQKGNFEQALKFTPDKVNKLMGSLGVMPQWLKEEDKFWYTYTTPKGKNWYIVDADKKSKRTLFDQEDMASQLAEIFKKPFNSKELPLNEFKYDKDKKLFSFNVDSIKFNYDQNNRKLIKLDSLKKEKDKSWMHYSPDSSYIVFARKHNLYLMKGKDKDSVEVQLTKDGERWYSYQADGGDTTSTKRLRADAAWFDDNKKLYVVREDKRKVKDLWVINSLKKRPELETYKYEMPGEPNITQQEAWVFDVASKAGVKLKTDKWKDQTLNVYTAKKNSDYAYVMRMDRAYQKIDMLKANTATGESEVLFSEEVKPYIWTSFVNFHVIDAGKEFIWLSERSGWPQLYLFDDKGKLKNKITEGYFVVSQVDQIDTLRRVVYFTGNGKEDGISPYYSLKYKVNFDGTGLKLLTPENASHSLSMGDKQNYFVDNYSRVDQTPKSVLRDKNGKVVLDLEETDLSAAKAIGWKFPEQFMIKAADGITDLYGVMWKPADFDSTKKYPIITYVYPGPQTEPFPITFGNNYQAALAQVGFIVVAFGQRGGSPLRSKYYHNFGYGDLRDYPLPDNKYGLEQLAARYKYIDINKVGIYGHSGGGFMSTAAILTYPDFYKVAVSSSGNHDNNIYNKWWSEIHNGVKEKTKKIKKKNNKGEEVETTESTFEAPIETNVELAKNLKGHLLLVTGDIDNNVHPANTYRVADALMKAGKRFDFMIMPGQRHGYGPYNDYFEKTKWYYFSQHLLGDVRNNIEINYPADAK
jgi:dipeptidyl aminopeptidase/acylaminoacyl peptidase